MRSFALTIGLLVCLFTIVLAWSKEDQEIFRLRAEIEASEGTDVSFYDIMGIKPSANQDDIMKAYKKQSKLIHPDKVKRQFISDKTTGKDKAKSAKPGVHVSKGPSAAEIKAAVKSATERFTRLGLINEILKGPSRERYDHFMANGFPKWKGTGYYYSRFRPGLGSVLVGLFIFVGGAGHYIMLYASWKRQQDFITRYIKFARNAAWGDNFNIPGLDDTETAAPAPAQEEGEAAGVQQPRNRRERRMQEKEFKKEKPEKKTKKAAKISPVATPPANITGPKKRVVAENGKILVVDSAGNVYLEQKDGEGETHEFLLDPKELPPPTIKDTALYRAPIWVYNASVGRFLNKAPLDEDENEAEAEAEQDDLEVSDPIDDESEDFEILEKVKTSSENGTGKADKRSKKSSRGR